MHRDHHNRALDYEINDFLYSLAVLLSFLPVTEPRARSGKGGLWRTLRQICLDLKWESQIPPSEPASQGRFSAHTQGIRSSAKLKPVFIPDRLALDRGLDTKHPSLQPLGCPDECHHASGIGTETRL